MTERVLLVDIGAGELPAMTPVVPVYASWLPVVAPPAGLAPPTGVVSTPVADGVLLQWAGLGPYEHIRVEIAPAPAGPWTPLAEVHEGTQYLVTLPAGATEARVVRVKAGIDSAPVNLGTVTPNLLTEVTADMLAEAAADATAKANAAKAEATARANALQAQINDVVGTADDWTNANPYPAGDSVRYSGHLYRAKIAVPANTPPPNATYWEDVGNYASVGEAVAATVAKSQQNASAIAAEVQRVDGIVVRLPAGNGALASSAMVADEATARANADGALSQRTGVIEGRMPTGNDKLANEARVVTAETASADRDSALAIRATALETKVNDTVTGVAANAAAVDSTKTRVSRVERPNPNLHPYPTFARALTGWNVMAGNWYQSNIYVGSCAVTTASPSGYSYIKCDIEGLWGVTYTVSAEVYRDTMVGNVYFSAYWVDAADNIVGSEVYAPFNAAGESGTRKSLTIPFPGGAAVKLRTQCVAHNTDGAAYFTRFKVERDGVVTPFSQEAEIQAESARLTSVSADVAGKASASVVQSMEAFVGTKNLLANAAMQMDIRTCAPQWFSDGVAWNATHVIEGNIGDGNKYLPVGWRGVCITRPTALVAGQQVQYRTGGIVDVRDITTLVASVYHNSFRCQPFVGVNFYDAAGNYLSSVVCPAVANAYLVNPTAIPRISVAASRPANAATAVLICGAMGTGEANPAMFFAHPQLEGVRDGRSQPTVWSPGGYEANARATLYVDANGVIGGVDIASDGTRSKVKIDANEFEVVTGDGYGLALDKTKMDLRFTGMAVYQGNSFGPDSLGFWIGPNTIAKSGATKANAAFWVDYSGQYGGGSAITGAGNYFQKETAASNTLTATTVSFPRSTTRAAREITAVLSMSVQSTKYSNDGTGSSAFSTPFVVEVSRDGGAWTQIDSQGMCNGTITRDNSEPGITYYEANGRGSIVAYDTGGGTNLQYRARETGSMPSVGASAIPNRTISIKVTEI